MSGRQGPSDYGIGGDGASSSPDGLHQLALRTRRKPGRSAGGWLRCAARVERAPQRRGAARRFYPPFMLRQRIGRPLPRQRNVPALAAIAATVETLQRLVPGRSGTVVLRVQQGQPLEVDHTLARRDLLLARLACHAVVQQPTYPSGARDKRRAELGNTDCPQWRSTVTHTENDS